MNLRKVLIVVMLIGVLALAGCAEDLPPKEFLKATYNQTAKEYAEQDKYGGKVDYYAEIKMDPEEVDRVINNLPQEFQLPLPLSSILKNELKGEMTMDLKIDMNNFVYGGKIDAGYTTAIMSQQFKGQFFMDPTTEGGLFYNLYNTGDWKMLAPGSAIAPQMGQFKPEDFATMRTWEDIKEELSEEEVKLLEDLIDRFMENLTIISDETENGIRTIEFSFDFATIYSDIFELYFSSDMMKEYTDQEIPEEDINMIKEQIDKYAKGIKTSVTIKADAKEAITEEMQMEITVDKDSAAVKELSSYLGFEEPIDVALVMGGTTSNYKIESDETVRPAGFTPAKQKELVDQFIQKTTEQAKTSIDMLGQAVENYYTNYGQFPETLNDMLESPAYLKYLMDPFRQDHQFKYEYEGKKYKIYSAGPDGKYETSDDIIKKGQVE